MKISELHKKNLKNPAYSKAYHNLQWDIEHEASKALVRARIQAGLSQEDLAKLSGKQQASIARAEGGSITPSLTYLNDVAKAMGLVVEIHFKKAKTLKEIN